ncbi:hypothetical protein JR316_0000358 [Psilocybe cubensis]|uniref:Uncharacterized protein n=2 Tax=Psilocybe cubensis TaxID=181762 RepID=A0ACB8HEP3_PSICU|nr:hypothetical protein JR316_0000358 [Psilocybe cubensis]KAH9486294.1 hypothetical protein JR316_0000358 [Psilocybe cubensis]
MQRVGTSRPGLVSSVSRFCRYSTNKPDKSSQPRQLVTEWGGIVIPSRSEIQEKEKEQIRKLEESKTDLSYLKNASNHSLAARLARRKDAAPASPPPAKVEPISPEAMEEMIQKRREIRLAREKAEAERAMRLYTPNAALKNSLETVAANYQSTPTVLPRTQSLRMGNVRPPSDNAPRTRNARPSRQDVPRVDNAPRRSGNVERVRERPQVSVHPVISDSTIENASHEAPVEDVQDDGEQPAVTDQLTLDDITRATIRTNDLERADDRSSRRGRIATSQAKKLEKRIRDGLVDEGEATKFKNSGIVIKQKFVTKEAIQVNIEQRRQARLDREQESEANGRRQARRGPNTRLTKRETDSTSMQPLEDGAEVDFSAEVNLGEMSISEDVVNVDPAYTEEPESISATLTDIFKGTSAFRSAGFKKVGLRKAGLIKENYSIYVPDSTAALFSVPARELSAVDIANLALAHHSEIDVPRRKVALDLIAAATRPRSAGIQANS